MGSAEILEPADGLGNQKMLSIIDQLRELGLGTAVPLPQLVVVGDQSSGKSSVLESLTGFSFPRDTGLCTRYATQITCVRDKHSSVSISVIPRDGADAARKDRLKQFYRHVTDTKDHDFAQIFEDANKTMGIRPRQSDNLSDGLSTFSEDILKIEIHGPQQNHLTVIDVPGIFRTATPGLTSETDIELVSNMVKRYMKDSRTIILAVVPCNVDIATQEILKLAKDADPSGVRTMGVLTKPDLVMEQATTQAILDLINGKRRDLELGYCVVKNRGADDVDSSLAERHRAEEAFFTRAPWSSLMRTGRVGIESLRSRLRELLMTISKREFPAVKADIRKRLADSEADLERMGPARGDASTQRVYLTQLASRFQKIAGYALNAYYTQDPIFDRADMRLITRIELLNHAFANMFATKGHMRHFDDGGEANEDGCDDYYASEYDEDDTSAFGPDKVSFQIPLEDYSELQDIICTDSYECPSPTDENIMKHIGEVFNNSRGPELGTFGGDMLGTTFREQSKKWEPLVLAHVSNAVAVVHHFVEQLFHECFPEEAVRQELWDAVLRDELCEGYKTAMQHANFLLVIEREGKPITVNHYFNASLQKSRAARQPSPTATVLDDLNDEEFVKVSDLRRKQNSRLLTAAPPKGNPEQVREDIHDILRAYYRVSRKRFVDVVCQQVVSYQLLNGPRSPLRLLSPDRVASLSETELELIAGEDAQSKEARRRTAGEIEGLRSAIRILRG